MLPTWSLSILKSILALIIVILLFGCIRTTVPTATNVPKPEVSCDMIRREYEFSQCLQKAQSGDANAAFNIAKVHEKFSGEGKIGELVREVGKMQGFSMQGDRATALYWYKVAADLGHKEALRTVYEGYYFGRYGSENKKEAKRYLKYAADLGYEWAMLVLGNLSEKEDPEKAIGLYMDLAIKNNCHAQRKLTRIYFEGKLVPQDLCKSYFWALLASAGGSRRHSENHYMAETGGGFASRDVEASCDHVGEKYKIEKELAPKYIQMVQDAASRWQKGDREPDFPNIQVVDKEKPALIKTKPPVPQDVSRATIREELHKWTPAQVDLNKRLTSNLSSSEVFKLVNPSVWTVISASTSANLKGMNNVSLASAVAINENNLLTNYHVIEGKPYVVVQRGDRLEKASIISCHRETDRCILHVGDVALKPVRGFRKYDDLVIGETVYSVGSPKGLENTLGQGIISGKRELTGLKLIQTTAQISRGSSGGGLFDNFGNLIGITTFKLVDSEGLNFAIAIDNFTQ